MFNTKYTKTRLKRKKLRLARVLQKKPNRKSIVTKITVITPRKPNSARRKSVKSRYRTGKVLYSYIPGGNHPLKKFSSFLVKGKGARDLPGIYTNGIRGCLDLSPLKNRSKRRSLYGIPKAKC